MTGEQPGARDDSVALLERAVRQTAGIIAAIRPDQESLSTPCPQWDVRALLRHVVAQGMRNFTARARGEEVDWQAAPEELAESWAAAFAVRSTALLDAWRHADLDQPVAGLGGSRSPLRNSADQQITELAIHGWDLVRATGQPVGALDPALAERALAWSRPMLRPEFRGPGKPFGPEVPVADDAPSYDRLAGWLGRDPAWAPPS